MIDYMNTIATYHTDLEVSMTDCCDYTTIDWNGNASIAQTVLDDEWLGIYKSDRIAQESALAEADIVDGFQSDALAGVFHWYDSSAEDQLNLIGSVAAGDDTYYACRHTQYGDKTYDLHTNAQLIVVVQDGRDVKLGILQAFTVKKDLILQATTKAEVDAV